MTRGAQQETAFITSGVVSGKLEYLKFDPDKITESTAHSFYQNSVDDLAPCKR